jgi:AcrR family transcriptional regulator
MPKVVEPELQRAKIREAARRVFAERGVSGTGLAHVADAARMGRSSLYHYYPDKPALIAELVQEALDGERALFAHCLGAGGTPLERLERLADACAALFPAWAAFGRVFLDLRLADARLLRDTLRDLRRGLAAVVAEGQRDGSLNADADAEITASLLMGAIDGLLLQYFVEPDAFPDPQQLADALRETTRRIVSA